MWRIQPQKAECPKLRKNEKNQRNNKKNPKKNYAKNLTCYYCGKKGHIEKDCFKKKRDAEQGIVKPVCKNVEKEEQTETVRQMYVKKACMNIVKSTANKEITYV